MATPRLPNYLRTQRKRKGLSQEDVAFLLGVEAGEKVCRHERFAREPSLQTALAYEAIFQKPLSEIFAGLFEKIEKNVQARAGMLASDLNPKTNRRTMRKHQTLSSLATLKVKKNNKA